MEAFGQTLRRWMFGRQDTPFNEQGNPRGGIDPAKRFFGQTAGFNDLSVRSQPGFHDGAQPCIRRLHPAHRYLIEELDEGVGLRDGRDGALQRLLSRIHRQFIEQDPGPRGSPQLPQAPPPDGTHPPVAPTPNGENCFSSFVARHFGQTASVEPCTNNSNR